ncbi:hypothetical protein CDAR_30621 [Caerostris darwini]|uniref:Uncharacterized protein n=1 Tax=Caerostris darwini TaxID=1538125 RepID=A0AAV4U4J8_9ARAC|nr:hypothetical protein CDAR_30621 [Caerostris darwini]
MEIKPARETSRKSAIKIPPAGSCSLVERDFFSWRVPPSTKGRNRVAAQHFRDARDVLDFNNLAKLFDSPFPIIVIQRKETKAGVDEKNWVGEGKNCDISFAQQPSLISEGTILIDLWYRCTNY